MLIQCPSCGHAGNIPDSSKPGKVRCPRCGDTFQVGLPDPRDIPMEVLDDAPALNIAVTDEGLESYRPRIVRDPGEPWYYWFLELWGKFFIGLAILAALIFTLFFVVVQVGVTVGSEGIRSYVNSAPIIALGSVWVFVFAFLPVIIAWLTIAAVILLLVDQARNIRRLRLNSESHTR